MLNEFQEMYEHISVKHNIWPKWCFLWFFEEKFNFTDLSIKSTNQLDDQTVLVDQQFLKSKSALDHGSFA